MKFNKKKKRSFVQNYIPAKDPIHAWKEEVQVAARQAYQGEPIDGQPISLSVKFLMPWPARKTVPDDRAWHISKPDTDNLVKAIKDALTGMIWQDDCLVCREILSKEYHSANEQPGCVVMIEVIAP